MPRRRTLLFATLTLAIFTLAWLTGRQTALSTSNTTRLYDVRDLLNDPPDFNDPPGVRPSAALTTYSQAAAPPASAPSTNHSVEDLIRAIRQSIETTTWNQPGHDMASIANHLAVTHNHATHQKIEQFLSDLRASRRLTITIEARFLTINPPNSPSQRLRDHLAAHAGKPMNDTQLQQFLENIRSTHQADISTVSAPRLTLFSGQRAYVMTGTQRAYVVALSQIPGPNGATFEPEIDIANSGVLLDARATAGPDRKHVTLNLRPELSELLDIQEVDIKMPAGKSIVQRPILNVKTLQTSLTIPTDHTVLITGFEYMATTTQPTTTRPTTRPTDPVYLLIKTTTTLPTDEKLKTLPSIN